jgi:hypothetical protein
MKLGAAYNLFDGEELLESSILSIKNHVDFITVIYQDISNYGNKSSTNLKNFLEDLKTRNLIDSMVLFTPNLKINGAKNETIKRNLGLDECRAQGCTHHLSIDTDEFYIAEEFEKGKEVIEQEKFDSSSCQLVTYYGSPYYKITPPETYYVPWIYRIKPEINFILDHTFPTLVDATRRMQPGKHRIFKRDEIQMHHMSYVRKDMNTKLQNSTCRPILLPRIKAMVDHWKNWKEGDPGLMGGPVATIKTEHPFNMNSYYKHFAKTV